MMGLFGGADNAARVAGGGGAKDLAQIQNAIKQVLLTTDEVERTVKNLIEKGSQIETIRLGTGGEERAQGLFGIYERAERELLDAVTAHDQALIHKHKVTGEPLQADIAELIERVQRDAKRGTLDAIAESSGHTNLEQRAYSILGWTERPKRPNFSGKAEPKAAPESYPQYDAPAPGAGADQLQVPVEPRRAADNYSQYISGGRQQNVASDVAPPRDAPAPDVEVRPADRPDVTARPRQAPDIQRSQSPGDRIMGSLTSNIREGVSDGRPNSEQVDAALQQMRTKPKGDGPPSIASLLPKADEDQRFQMRI